MVDKKVCFVIAPIGHKGSDVRLRSNQILDFVIRPAVECLGYEALRADEIVSNGLITATVIRYLDEAPLVIANLTGSNPNVFYELAIRHAVKKPTIQLLPEGEEVPFDLADMPTIRFPDITDPQKASSVQAKIVDVIQYMELQSRDFHTPISLALGQDRIL